MAATAPLRAIAVQQQPAVCPAMFIQGYRPSGTWAATTSVFARTERLTTPALSPRFLARTASFLPPHSRLETYFTYVESPLLNPPHSQPRALYDTLLTVLSNIMSL